MRNSAQFSIAQDGFSPILGHHRASYDRAQHGWRGDEHHRALEEHEPPN
jgi:hypothetical protein